MTQQVPQFVQSGFSSLNNSQRTKRWDEGIPWFDMPENKWVQLRFVGPIYAVGQHWFKTKTNKRFALLCPAYDPKSRRYDHKDKCACEALIDYNNTENQHIKSLAPRQTIFMHAIIRELQTKGEAQYLRPMRLPITLALAISNLKGMNIVQLEGVNYEVDVSDPNYGADIMVFSHAQPANPSQKYQVQFFQKTPLQPHEANYEAQLHNWETLIQYPSYNDILQALERNGYLEKPKEQAAIDQFTPVPPPPPTFQGASVPAPPQMTAPVPVGFTPPATFQPQQQAVYQAPPPAAPQMMAPQQMMAPPPMQAAPQMMMAPPAPAQMAPPAPMGAMPVQTPVAQPAMAVPTPGGAQGKKFQVSGRPEPVGVQEFQQLVQDYAGKLERGNPMKLWDGKDDVANLNVLACFAKYNGDGHCLKCPLRRWCIQY